MITTLENCKVCITGKLDKMVRRIAFDKIRAVGGFPQMKITTDTDYLVVADDFEEKEYPSYKIEKANEWWIDCITEEDFYYLIGEEDESRKSFA